ncbi:MAG TPA: CUAEP/CCAEP-tail radical SAM protein [Acidimicrobiales bacterium]|nr:CUAEP/CCAEP-tail radical SAM protein [Acidimicrobiales bacterium]
MRVLLVSTYELGRQPLHLATAAAALLAAGHDVSCVDVAVDTLDCAVVDWADRVAFSVPMHTAMRLALRVAATIRARRPELPVCFYGLYAAMSRDLTVRSSVDAVIAGEYEHGLVAWVAGDDPGPAVQLTRQRSRVPARYLLPPLDRYARLAAGGEERLVGSVEAGRGCSHRCRHCPVPVVYNGRVRPAEVSTVLADVDQLVAAGARHLTFADPDFLNTPLHSRRVISAIHERYPHLTFDCTTKVEHILRHREVIPELARAGCAFVVCAFESVNDTILGHLDKGHTVADASEAVAVLRGHGIEIRPSWLPFTPWTTPYDLVDLIDFVVAHDLVPNVDPVQYTVRLLVPEGSLLLGQPSMTPFVGTYDQDRLGWTWSHPDPAVDELQDELAQLVERRVEQAHSSTFEEIDALIRTDARTSRTGPKTGAISRGPAGERARLTEAWFCCSEPTAAQLAPLLPLSAIR